MSTTKADAPALVPGNGGLTKREVFVLVALHALLSSGNAFTEDAASTAVTAADEAIRLLNEGAKR